MHVGHGPEPCPNLAPVALLVDAHGLNKPPKLPGECQDKRYNAPGGSKGSFGPLAKLPMVDASSPLAPFAAPGTLAGPH